MTDTTNLPYTLGSGIEMNALYPDSFWIPSPEEKAALKVGDFVKLMFFPVDGPGGERMWVQITSIHGDQLTGTLSNNPVCIEGLEYDDEVAFHLDHVINFMES